jgi:hypothetical protein
MISVPDAWNHQHKEWRETLDLARQRGWPPPTKGTNHGVLVLNCPDNDVHCRIKVFSTGAGTESVARNSRKKIQRCPHGNFEDRFDEIDHLLDNAERLLSAAAAELERREAEAEAEALLQLADDPLAEAAELLDANTRYDSVVDAEAQLGYRRDELLQLDERDSTPDELVVTAGSDLRRATQSLRDLPSASDRHHAASARLAQADGERERLRQLCADVRGT